MTDLVSFRELLRYANYSDPYAMGPQVGLYPIITSQYSSTTVYQVSYHIQSLVF